VDQIARSNQRPVYLDLLRPHQCKVKSQWKRCKIDKRLWFFSFVSVYPVNESANIKSEKNLVINRKQCRKRSYNLHEYSLLASRYNSTVHDDI